MDPTQRIPQSAQDNATLCYEYEQGESATVLGHRYNVSKATVLNRLRACGIVIRPRGNTHKPLCPISFPKTPPRIADYD